MSGLSPEEQHRRVEHLGNMLDKLMAVNGLFITAGYGTFFGIWAISKDSLGLHEKLWACLFLLMSSALFVVWHVVGILTMNLVLRRVAVEPAEGWASRVTNALRENAVKMTTRYGMLVNGVTLVLALAGIAILAIGLIRGL